jgi:hypothetical protein
MNREKKNRRKIKPSDHTLFYHATSLAIDDLVVHENQRYCRTQVGPSFRTIAVASRLSIPFLPSALSFRPLLSLAHTPPSQTGWARRCRHVRVDPSRLPRRVLCLRPAQAGHFPLCYSSRLTTSFNSKVAGMGMGKGHERIDYFIKR